MNVSMITDQQCCGCGICSLVCSGGVNLRLDKDGYYKSRINESKCIDCGKCMNVCPCNSNPDKIISSPAYIAYSKKRDTVLRSSSGGIAYQIAEKYLELGYNIIGAVWSDDYNRVEHIVIKEKTELGRLRKSKYVQSYTPDAFSEIRNLDKVIVFGTPCQIAGLRNLYGNRDGMVLIDFDCMGPAGLEMWNKYLDYLQSNNNSGIKSLEMRHKKKSWMVYGTRVLFEDGKVYYKDKYHDPFCQLYHLAHTIQDSCVMNCKFLNHTMADIRIGDAWNYTQGYTRKQIHDGLSIIIPQTKMGNKVLDSVSDLINMKGVTRIPNKPIIDMADKKIWDILRNPDLGIEDAVQVYNDVALGKKWIRKVSYALSSNDTLYLISKKLMKLL